MLAREMCARAGLPVVHIDRIHWQPGWRERSAEVKTRLCREVEARDRWMFEGGHSATWPERVARADLLVWIDRPVGLRIWRVLRRTLTDLGRTRPDLPQGCTERLDLLPEFLRFIWTTRRSARIRLDRLTETAPPSCQIVKLCSDREVAAFLSTLGPSQDG